tara:strand:+ start:478 stop:867 length:390 start_codon:yes stop_codon:yes gene_type:complete
VVKRYCFSISNYFQFEKIIKLKKNKNRTIVVYIKNYLIKGFGINWLITLIKKIKNNYSKYNIKFYVDAKNDHGLSILIMREEIDYIKLKSNKVILNKINQIAKKNKVLLNPNFDVVETSNLKNIKNINI